MATHDYVIANGTGAAVRSDLNNALAAIVSNNSGSSQPSTRYAYQWWADTTTGQLKLRNSANNAWVTIFELDGTMLMDDGTVSAPGLAFASDLNTGIFRPGADQLNISTNGAERLSIGNSEIVFNDASNDVDFRVESNGQTHMLFVDGGNDRVGIGTAAPSGLLAVHQAASSTSNYINITNNATGSSSLSNGMLVGVNDAGDALCWQNENQPLRFGTNNNERGRFTSAGDFLVGTSSAGGVGGFTFFPTGSGGSPMLTWNKSSASSTTSALFQRNSSTVGAISYTSSAVTYATSSDYRLKENVADIDDGITRVKQLLPKRFNFIVNADKTVDGFLAHEAQAVVPEAVTGEKDGEEMQGIDQSKFVPLLTAALQEAIAKIETLETKVAALEAG